MPNVFCKCDCPFDYHTIRALCLLMVSFSLSISFKVSDFYYMIFYGFTKFFHAIFTSVYIILQMHYIIKYPCGRHGKCPPTFVCGRFFGIIFTSTYFCNQRFNTCINKKWFPNRFIYWANSNIFFSSRGISNHGSLYFYILFMWFKLDLCSKRMKAMQTIKVIIMFWLIPLNNADSLFTFPWIIKKIICVLGSKVNLKKLFVSCSRVANECHTQAAGKSFFFTEFWQFLELVFVVNVYVTLY